VRPRDALADRLLDLGLLKPLRRARRRLSPAWRADQARLAAESDKILTRFSTPPAEALARCPRDRAALVVGQGNPGFALFQLPLLAGLRASGHRITVALPAPAPAMERLYAALGVEGFVFIEDYLRRAVPDRALRAMEAVTTLDDALALSHAGCAVGKYALSTLMRRTRRGDIPLDDPATAAEFRAYARRSVAYAEAQTRLVATARPDLVCFYDRGYTPDGELFDAALAAGARATTLNAAHRSGLLMLKRYHPGNRDRHPASLSAESWAAVKAMPWSDAHWRALHDELADAYRSGAWYDEVGTQRDRAILDRERVFAALGLDPAKKTAVVFAHLFWDATFFWGRDLFGTYEAWFKAVARVAARNPGLNWVFKVHPANLVKSRRDGYAGEPSESVALREVLGALPAHVKLMPADHPVSTFSLFDAMDYCLTVRGTVGLEAACFGIPTITAGTGRYDRKGFTVDPETPEDYLARLDRLGEIPPLSPAQTELARRYAWALLRARPVATRCVRFRYEADGQASLTVEPDPAVDDLLAAPDVRAIAAWLESGAEDHLALPETGG